MTDNHEIESAVGDYIRASFLADAGAALGWDDDLLEVLDSLQVIRTILFVETSFGVKVEDADMTPENLGSVSKLAALVARKRAALPEAVSP